MTTAERAIATTLTPPRDDPSLRREYSVDLRLLGLSQQTTDARLLDLGAGAGRHELAAVKLPLRTVTCDLSLCALREGRFFVGEEQGRLSTPEWAAGSGPLLPFRDATFDAAICSETLEHVAEDTAVLAELRRVTRAGGRLAVSVPAYWPEFVLWQLSWAVTHIPGGHGRIYQQGQLLARLRATGWQPYAVRRRHAFETVYWLLGALGGGGNPPCRLAQEWRKATIQGSVPVDRVERMLAPLLAKSIVVYARAV